MRADPEPDHVILIPHRQRAIRQTHTSREDRARGVYLFEPKTGMKGIVPKQLVGEPRLSLHLRRQGSEGLAKPLGRV